MPYNNNINEKDLKILICALKSIMKSLNKFYLNLNGIGYKQ